MSSGDSYVGGGNSAWSDAHLQSPFQQADMLIRYAWDEGKLQMGVAATPAAAGSRSADQVPSVIVQTHAPTGQLEIRWTARRLGAPPIALDPYGPTGDSNVILRGYLFELQSPVLDVNGTTRWYRCGGTYQYFLQRPVSPSDGYKLGTLPYDSGAGQVTTFDKSYLSNSLF